MRKVALVTGASRGLGAHVARALAGAGYRVAVNYRRDEEAARRVAAELPEGLSIRGDVGSAAEVSGMAGLLEERWGRLDVLVNNAGIVRDALLLALGEEDWDRVLAVNLRGGELQRIEMEVFRQGLAIHLEERPYGPEVFHFSSDPASFR
ncbi:MAG: SDR family NAD(P)-dependent oxidoreductase [Acidobacteriota bacterium]